MCIHFNKTWSRPTKKVFLLSIFYRCCALMRHSIREIAGCSLNFTPRDRSTECSLSPRKWSDTMFILRKDTFRKKTVAITQQYRRLLLARLSSRCCQCWSDWWSSFLQVVAASSAIASGSGGMLPPGWPSTWTSSAGSWSRWRARGWTPGRSRGWSSCTAGTAQTSRQAGGKKYFLDVFFKMQELKCETLELLKHYS